jgi:hypothetical protein
MTTTPLSFMTQLNRAQNVATYTSVVYVTGKMAIPPIHPDAIDFNFDNVTVYNPGAIKISNN